jgi:putative protease
MKDFQVELLAPVGNYEMFVGAINAGANAVYLAGKEFGARKFATNFTIHEIEEMVKYAHLRNVKVFITVNTIIMEEEIDSLLAYTDQLVEIKVDALIVQDLGVIEHLVKRYPNTEIHASTQMNAYTVSQVEYLKKIGVSRVILARETSINTIKEIRKIVDIDLEVFVHGALCVAYSGNCLLSQFRGGRSGNRGECAQPCRLPYQMEKDGVIVSEKEYIMSTKDLMTLPQLSTIIESGIMSLKVEGRMRSKEYVMATIRAYKEAIEAYRFNKVYDIDKAINDLMVTFNRDFTKGYISEENPAHINNKNRPNHQGVYIGTVTQVSHGKVSILLQDNLHVKDGIRVVGQKDFGGQVHRILIDGKSHTSAKSGQVVTIDLLGDIFIGDKVYKTTSKVLEVDLNPFLSENYKLVPLQAQVTAQCGKALSITLSSPQTSIVFASDYIVQQANNRPLTKEGLSKQIGKLGNTMYFYERLDIDSNDDIFIPNGVLNQLRRDSIEMLEDKTISLYNSSIVDIEKEDFLNVTLENQVVCKVETKEQYDACVEESIDQIIVTEDLFNKIKIRDTDIVLLNRVDSGIRLNHPLVMANDYGAIAQYKAAYVNHPLNVVNHKTVETLIELGVRNICLSLESSFNNTKDILLNFKKSYTSNPPLHLIVYGKQDAMVSKYCPITKSQGVLRENCHLCEHHSYSLIDSKQDRLHIIRDSACNVRLVQDTAHNLIKEIPSYLSLGLKQFRLDFLDESKAVVKALIKKTKEMI